jgi:hypothetical protein
MKMFVKDLTVTSKNHFKEASPTNKFWENGILKF